MTTTIHRATHNNIQHLLDNQGMLSPFKKCIDPEQHKAIATYYRKEAQLYVCDMCNETPEWIQQNLWRYPVVRQKMLRTLLHIPQCPSDVAINAISPVEVEKGTLTSLEHNEALGASQDVVEKECCSSCGDKEDVSCVGMDGEMLCERCWGIVLSIMSR